MKSIRLIVSSVIFGQRDLPYAPIEFAAKHLDDFGFLEFVREVGTQEFVETYLYAPELPALDQFHVSSYPRYNLKRARCFINSSVRLQNAVYKDFLPLSVADMEHLQCMVLHAIGKMSSAQALEARRYITAVHFVPSSTVITVRPMPAAFAS